MVNFQPVQSGFSGQYSIGVNTVGRPIPQLRAIFLSLRPLANFKRNTSFILRMDNLFVGISIPLNIEKDQDAGLVILRRTHLPEN